MSKDRDKKPTTGIEKRGVLPSEREEPRDDEAKQAEDRGGRKPSGDDLLSRMTDKVAGDRDDR